MIKNKSLILFLSKKIGYNALDTLINLGIRISTVIVPNENENIKTIELAKNKSIDIHYDLNLKEEGTIKILKKYDSKRALNFSYPKIFGKKIIDHFSMGIINFHPAKLPQYRGCYPTIYPIINGDKTVNITMHYIDEGIDTGDIIDTWCINIDSNSSGFSVYSIIENDIKEFLKTKIPSILTEKYVGKKQNNDKANYYNKLLPNNGVINWHNQAEYIFRYVNALYHPKYESAVSNIDGVAFEILEIKIEDDILLNDLYSNQMVGPFFIKNILYAKSIDKLLRITKIKNQHGIIYNKNLKKNLY